MSPSVKKILFTIGFSLTAWHAAFSQDLKRELNVGAGATVEVVNKFGRVGVTAAESGFGLTASSAKGVTDSEIKISDSSGRTVITVATADKKKRIDIILNLPERTNLKIETAAGAVEIGGNFASIEAKSETGTIAVDIPPDDVHYRMQWTESRPRYLADFDHAAV